MATIYWQGNVNPVAVVYRVTVTATATGGTVSATINGFTCTYTATSTDTTTSVATNAAQAFKSFTSTYFSLVSWTSSGNVITATGPSDGRPVAVTWAADGALCTITGGGSPAVSATSPNDISNFANLSTGTTPANGDTIIFDGKKPSVYYGLAALASLTVNIIVRQGYTGSFGLPDSNSNGFNEYLPTRLQTKGTAINITANGAGTFRIQSTAASAVTLTFVGKNSSQTLEITGFPASSVVNMNGGGLVIAPLDADACTIATLNAYGKGSVSTGPSPTIGTANFFGSSGDIACGYTTLLVDNGSKVSTRMASAGTTTNVLNGTLTWGSTGSIGTYTIGDKGTIDFGGAPSAISVTAGTILDGGTLVDKNKVTGGYNLTVKDFASVNLTVGNGRTLTYT
jgi:hypothetical protein